MAENPHQIATVSSSPGQSGLSVAYEEDGPSGTGNGGMTWRPALGNYPAAAISYDPRRRVSLVDANGVDTVSLYDADGERRVRIVDGLYRTYFDPYFTVESGEMVRQISFGGRVVALSQTRPGSSPLVSKTCKAKSSAVAPKLTCNAVLRRAVKDPAIYGDGWTLSPQANFAEKEVQLPINSISWVPPAPTATNIARVGLRIDGARVGCRGIEALIIAGDRSEVFTDSNTGFLKVSDDFEIAPSIPLYVAVLAPSCEGRKVRLDLKVRYRGDAAPAPASDAVHFLIPDRLGSTTMLTSYYGTPVQYYRYGPYGETEVYDAAGNDVSGSSALTDILYTGQRRDEESSLYYYGARFYDPATARFLTHDPVHNFVNPYAYVSWTPTNATDPTGEFIELLLIDVPLLTMSYQASVGSWTAATPFWTKVFEGSMFALDVGLAVTPIVPPGVVQGVKTGGMFVRRLHAATAVENATDGVRLVNGRRPINSAWAGKMHPSGVRFSPEGFPDFSPVARGRVELQGLTGNYAKDAAMANKAVGLPSTPDNMVWHHVEDGRTMLLVPKEIHNAIRHTGGAAVIRGQR